MLMVLSVKRVRISFISNKAVIVNHGYVSINFLNNPSFGIVPRGFYFSLNYRLYLFRRNIVIPDYLPVYSVFFCWFKAFY
jgi:hypothetical protein